MPTLDPSRSSSELPESLERRLVSVFDVAGPSLGARIVGLAADHPEHAEAIRHWYHQARAFAESPIADRRIAGYRLIRALGRGGMGEVYLAEHVELGRLVALKLMRADGSFSPAMRARFAREARTVSRLDHPHICPVYEVGDDRGQPFMVMRWIRGRSLAELIRGQLRSVTPAEAGATTVTPSPSNRRQLHAVLLVMEKVARALHVAHEQGLVHRDVKPGNIMLGDDGEPVVLDFGLAREWASDDERLTTTGGVLGTPIYMAPEQVDPRRGVVGPRTDVYALGATLYECLTLSTPLDLEPSHDLNQRILTVEPMLASKRNRALGRDVDVVLARAMDKDLTRRYLTASDFADDLRRLRLDEPIAARRTGVVRRTMKWTRRNPGVAAVLAVLSVGLMVTTILVFALQEAEAGERAVAADREVTSAEALVRDGEFAGALRSFKEAMVRGYPDRSRVLLGQLACHDGLGDLESVGEVLAELAAWPDHGRHVARVLLAQADSALWSQGDQAWPLLDRALALQAAGQAELTPTELSYARACRQEDLAEFVAGLEATRALDPKHYPSLTALGYAYLMQGRPDAAIGVAKQASALFPQDPYGAGLAALSFALLDQRKECDGALARLTKLVDDRAEVMARLLPKVLELVWAAQEVATAQAVNLAKGLPSDANGSIDVTGLAKTIVGQMGTLLQVRANGDFMGRVRAHPGIWRRAMQWIKEDVKPNASRLLAYIANPTAPESADGVRSVIVAVTVRGPDPLLRLVHQLVINRSVRDERVALQGTLNGAREYFRSSGVSLGFAGARRCVLAIAASALLANAPNRVEADNRSWAQSAVDQSLGEFVPEVCRLSLSDAELGVWVRCCGQHSDPAERGALVQRVLVAWRERQQGSPSRAYLFANASWAVVSGQHEIADAVLADLLRRWPADEEAKRLREDLARTASSPK